MSDHRPDWWHSQTTAPAKRHPSAGVTWEERFPDPSRPGPFGEFGGRFKRLTPERERELLNGARPKAAKQPRQAKANTYLIGAEGSPLVKIGFTSGAPKARMSSLQTGVPMRLSLLWSTEGNYEKGLHDRFCEHRVIGEWFDLTSLGDPVIVVQNAVAELQQTDTTK